jgi:hypothetical protein
MRNNKNLLYSIVIVLLIILSLTVSGCLSGDDNAASTGIPADFITRGQGSASFSTGSWLAKTAVDNLCGIAGEKVTDKLVSMIFGSPEDPNARKLDEIINQMSVLDGKIDKLAEQLAAVQQQIKDLAGEMRVAFIDLDASVAQKLGASPVAGITNAWKIFKDDLLVRVDAYHTREQVLAHCTTSVFLEFAVMVEPPIGERYMQKYVEEINNILMQGGLTAYSSGLLTIWAEQAIIRYARSRTRTSEDFIKCYNYIEMNFQNALIYECRAAAMIVVALQAIEQINPAPLITSESYQRRFNDILTAQADKFREEVERFVLSSINPNTNNADFLPAGYQTVFARADYIYLMLTGKRSYGLCGRVISPCDLSGNNRLTADGRDLSMSIAPGCDAVIVDVTAKKWPRKIDYWRTEFFDNVKEPVSTFNFSNKWYIYRYYSGDAVNETYGGTPFVKKVSLDFNNEIRNKIPVIGDDPVITAYDEATFETVPLPTSGSRMIKYGNFTLMAGFTGSSVFFSLPKYSGRPYIWHEYLSSNTNNSSVDSLYAGGDNPPRLSSAGQTGYSVSELKSTRCILTSSLRKIIKYGGTVPVTVKIFAELNTNMHNYYSIGRSGHYNNFVGISLSESPALDFASSSKLFEDGLRINRSSDDGGIVTIDKREGGNVDFSGVFSKEFSVTFQPGKYYRIALNANVDAAAEGYYQSAGFRPPRVHSTVYNLSSYGELKQLNFYAQ